MTDEDESGDESSLSTNQPGTNRPGTSRPSTMQGVLDALLDEAEDDSVEIGRVLDHFGSRAFAPILVLSGLVGVTPIGAVPGLPAVVATLALLVLVQYAIGRRRTWVPRFIAKRSIPEARIEQTCRVLSPVAKTVDKVLRPRFEIWVEPPLEYLLLTLALACAASYYVLGFIPFAISVPGIALLTIGLTFVGRDGLWAFVTLAVLGGGGWFLWGEIAERVT